jgi:hypothetical protein
MGDYRLELGFTNGVNGVVNLKDKVVARGGVFTPFKDTSFFSSPA